MPGFQPRPSCYSYHKLNDAQAPAKLQPVLEDSCVLRMQNSNRLIDPNWRLLTHTLTVQTNAGYKKCDKALPQQTTAHDLIHAYYTCFVRMLKQSHAKTNAKEFFLVLEDDFSVVPSFLSHAAEVVRFIQQNSANIVLYNLGPHVQYGPYLFEPVAPNHPKAWFQSTAHAVLYHRTYLQAFVQYVETYHSRFFKMTHGDEFHIVVDYGKNANILGSHVSMHSYKLPLVIQLFPHTKNFESWPLIGKLWHKAFVRPFNLHKNKGKTNYANYTCSYKAGQLFFGAITVVGILIVLAILIVLVRIVFASMWQ